MANHARPRGVFKSGEILSAWEEREIQRLAAAVAAGAF